MNERHGKTGAYDDGQSYVSPAGVRRTGAGAALVAGVGAAHHSLLARVIAGWSELLGNTYIKARHCLKIFFMFECKRSFWAHRNRKRVKNEHLEDLGMGCIGVFCLGAIQLVQVMVDRRLSESTQWVGRCLDSHHHHVGNRCGDRVLFDLVE